MSSSSEPTARTMKLLLPSWVSEITDAGELSVNGPSACRPLPLMRIDPGLRSPPLDGPAPGGDVGRGAVGAGATGVGAGAGLAGAPDPWSPRIRASTAL